MRRDILRRSIKESSDSVMSCAGDFRPECGTAIEGRREIIHNNGGKTDTGSGVADSIGGE